MCKSANISSCFQGLKALQSVPKFMFVTSIIYRLKIAIDYFHNVSKNSFSYYSWDILSTCANASGQTWISAE